MLLGIWAVFPVCLIVYIAATVRDERRDRRQDRESAARIAHFREVERVLAAETEKDPWTDLGRSMLNDLGIRV